MKPLRLKIKTECDNKKVPQYVIEKDYALSYILGGITQQPELANSLIFKGGTALKKIFFGNYRFSEDLDFSVINAPQNEVLENTLQSAIKTAKNLLTNYGPFDIHLKRHPENAPHPQGQEAFIALVQFPWQPKPMCRIKIEITQDEPVILTPEYKPILHGYNETLDSIVACYHIEEIIAEKMRALLQTHHKLITRGWNRPRARDYYDLWNVLKNYADKVDRDRLLEVLNKKCQHRKVSYRTAEDFFTDVLIEEAKKHWEMTLGVLVKELAECEEVLWETKKLINKLFEN